MLDKEKNIDAITISTPDHNHARIAYDCMNRGIHLYVQKPLTHTIVEARLLNQTAQKIELSLKWETKEVQVLEFLKYKNGLIKIKSKSTYNLCLDQSTRMASGS